MAANKLKGGGWTLACLADINAAAYLSINMWKIF
jgi:hypothetical protein